MDVFRRFLCPALSGTLAALLLCTAPLPFVLVRLALALIEQRLVCGALSGRKPLTPALFASLCLAVLLLLPGANALLYVLCRVCFLCSALLFVMTAGGLKKIFGAAAAFFCFAAAPTLLLCSYVLLPVYASACAAALLSAAFGKLSSGMQNATVVPRLYSLLMSSRTGGLK